MLGREDRDSNGLGRLGVGSYRPQSRGKESSLLCYDGLRPRFRGVFLLSKRNPNLWSKTSVNN